MRGRRSGAGHSDWAVLLVGERERGGRGTPQQRHPEEQDRCRNGNDEEPGEAGVRPADAGLAGLHVVVSVATNTTRARSHRAAGSWRVNHRGIPAANHASASPSVNSTASGSTSDPSSWVGAQRRYRPAVRGGGIKPSRLRGSLYPRPPAVQQGLQEASPSPVYGAALLMRFGSQAHPGFKSPSLRCATGTPYRWRSDRAFAAASPWDPPARPGVPSRRLPAPAYRLVS